MWKLIIFATNFKCNLRVKKSLSLSLIYLSSKKKYKILSKKSNKVKVKSNISKKNLKINRDHLRISHKDHSIIDKDKWYHSTIYK